MPDMMSEPTKIANSIEVETGHLHLVDVDGTKIILVRTEDELFAIQDVCPHQRRPLSTGTVEGSLLTCEHHGIEIDLASGKVKVDMGYFNLDDIQIYPIEERDGEIWLTPHS